MISHTLLKPILIFLAGVSFMLIAMQVLAHPEILQVIGNRDGDNLRRAESQVKDEIYKKEEKAAKSVTQTILEKVLPAAAENPVLAPVLETKQEVEQTVETIRNLPDAQKNAICKQVCGP